MEGFKNVKSHRDQSNKVRAARESARILSDVRIPGALWVVDAPLNRPHLPGIPYSYYDEEIVISRQRTAELVERQRAEARARARAQRNRQPGPGPDGEQWYTLDQGQVRHSSSSEASQWQGIDE
jgi:hypothetical protein